MLKYKFKYDSDNQFYYFTPFNPYNHVENVAHCIDENGCFFRVEYLSIGTERIVYGAYS